MPAAFLHMENHCEPAYISLFQMLQFMEIKIWFYKDYQTKILLGEDRCQRRKGGIDLFLLSFLFQHYCGCILCF